MTKRSVAVCITGLFMFSVVAQAQAPGAAKKPGPEHKRMGVMTGKWSGTGEMKAGPWGPGGKTTWTESCEWFDGGFSLVCRSEGTGPMGNMKGLSIVGYKPEEKQYIYMMADNLGQTDVATGTVQGKTWTWTGEAKMGGKNVKTRFTVVEQSADSQAFKWETSVDGGPWTTAMEGKSKRVK